MWLIDLCVMSRVVLCVVFVGVSVIMFGFIICLIGVLKLNVCLFVCVRRLCRVKIFSGWLVICCSASSMIWFFMVMVMLLFLIRGRKVFGVSRLCFELS